MKILLRLSFILLASFITSDIQAQLANCIDFSEFEPGSVFGQQQGNTEGELIYSNQGTSLQIDRFYDFFD